MPRIFAIESFSTSYALNLSRLKDAASLTSYIFEASSRTLSDSLTRCMFAAKRSAAPDLLISERVAEARPTSCAGSLDSRSAARDPCILPIADVTPWRSDLIRLDMGPEPRTNRDTS